MINRRTILTVIAGGALALPRTVLAAAPRVPPGQGGTPPGQGGTPPGQAGGNPGNGKGKNHKNGEALLGEKIKQNGNHKLDDAGKIEVSADVRGGKIVGFHAKHADKGELTVGKVKSMTKFAALERRQTPFGEPNVQPAQYLVEVWYFAYWFTDEFGNDWYYWFPVDYIVDDNGWVIYSA